MISQPLPTHRTRLLAPLLDAGTMEVVATRGANPSALARYETDAAGRFVGRRRGAFESVRNDGSLGQLKRDEFLQPTEMDMQPFSIKTVMGASDAIERTGCEHA